VTGSLVLAVGLLLAVLGLVGLVRGRVGRLGMRNRAVAAVVAAGGMTLALAAGGSASGAPDTLAAPPVRPGPVTANGAASPAESSASTPPPVPASSTPPAPVHVPRPSATPRPGTRPTPTVVRRAQAGTALAVLDALAVKGRAPRTGYQREQFGQAWADTDRNGCDTRNDILRRDLHALVLKAGTHGCLVLRGTLDDPYTGRVIAFERGAATSARVQIDHVVPLSDAWQKGAQQWSAQTRTRFANDPLNLLAVDGVTNQRKSDGDAATWLPPRSSYRCAYVARQTAVKARYRLWVTAAERDAVRRVLAACPAQRPPSAAGSVPLGGGRTAAAAPAPVPAPQPRSTSSRTSDPASHPSPSLDPRFGTCRAANTAGYGPYRSGVDPEYDWYRDRDHDGVVCER
jgi:Protein of unknown function (DUF1524)/Excalibur calcium-binding domain